MPDLKVIVGPVEKQRGNASMAWHFHAVDAQDSPRVYLLRFMYRTRRFKTDRNHARKPLGEAEIVFATKDWDGTLLTGVVTPRLIERLSKRDIAEAIGNAISYAGDGQ